MYFDIRIHIMEDFKMNEFSDDYKNLKKQIDGDKGKLIGLLFNVNFETPGPPFGGNIMEYKALFKERFNLLHFEITNDSIAPRLGSEIWMEMVKK